MRLRELNENISRKDFFDLYALIYAYQHDKHDNVVNRRLADQLRYILKDHIIQIGDILANRLGPHTTEDPRFAIYQKHGGEFKYDPTGKHITYSVVPHSEIVPLLQDIKKYGQTTDSYSMFTSTTGRWSKLLDTYLNDLMRIPSSVDGMIKHVDKIYALVHHGGYLTDYFDESKWIEDALNIRANAGIKGIIQLASSNVRELVDSGNYGLAERNVSQLQKLDTAINRLWPEAEIQTKIVNDSLVINGNIYLFYEPPKVPSLKAVKFVPFPKNSFLWDGAKSRKYEFTAIVRQKPFERRTSVPFTSSQYEISVNGSDFKPIQVSGNKAHAYSWAAQELERAVAKHVV